MPRRAKRRRLSAVSLNASFAQEETPAKGSERASESFVDLGENDDKAERSKARRGGSHRSHRNSNLMTPVRSVRRKTSNRSRRGSPSPFLPSAGGSRSRKIYTNDQLSQIYKDCIVKAQTGKINQQNAWNLHLVDNIKEITDLNTGNKASSDPSDTADTNAFARASHTIDAASKIYGYRVDSVHNKTYKVLGSIHQQSGNAEGADIDYDSLERKRKRQQRNRNVGKSTLCEHDKVYKLNETMKSLCVEVDALFHKTASCFDEGGAKGLLMNTLYVQNGCDIVFDSSTKIEQNEDITKHGVSVDDKDLLDSEQIEKEKEWMSGLFAKTFRKEVDADFNAFDGFTQPIDTTSPDFDVSTQTKPCNFVVDMKWIQTTEICPLLNLFQNNIDAISNKVAIHHASPEKDLNMNNASLDNVSIGDDDDVLMDMPDFTIGGGDDMNAQDLFHEELLTQAVDNVDSNGNMEYVLGQNADNIGNMGVQPLLNNSMLENQQILNNIQREQDNENGQYGELHRAGIYKRGAMNLTAMNEVISKLENADFESLTTFFDTKKHGNWAGPDQWYHRRYQLMTKTKTNTKTKSTSTNTSRSASKSPPKHRKKKQSTRFDFMSIARGNLIDEKEFEEPQRSFNTLTQGVLDKNRKSYHTLPKDLQIKPDMFIKLFHRQNYSVWKHWLRQHQMRMVKQQQDSMAMDTIDAIDDHHNMSNINMSMVDHAEPQFLQQQAAAMAVIDGDVEEEDEFQYNYNNPLDSSHFVPNMKDPNDNVYDFDFNLNGYDLIDMDPSKKLEKIQVEFATKAKKVNIRKLKHKLWDKLASDLPNISSLNKENVQNNSNRNNNEEEDGDIDMNDMKNNNEEKVDTKVTFQDALDSLPSNISSSISIHMCFICLLHLANEKELQFVPKTVNDEDDKIKIERGNFEIQYASSQSQFEKDAQNINPIMVLGMR